MSWLFKPGDGARHAIHNSAVAGFSEMLKILTLFKAEPSLNPTHIGIYYGGNMVGEFRY